MSNGNVTVARFNFSEQAAQYAVNATASSGVSHTVREDIGTFVVEVPAEQVEVHANEAGTGYALTFANKEV